MKTNFLTTNLKDLLNLKIDDNFNIDLHKIRKEIFEPDNAILTKYRHLTSLNEIEQNLEDGRFSVNINNINFNFLFHKKQHSKYLYVVYSGARGRYFPAFPRWSYYNLFDGSYLGIDDPMYEIYPTIKISWFYGENNRSYISDSIILVKKIASILKINCDNIIFFSSSGGGGMTVYMLQLL